MRVWERWFGENPVPSESIYYWMYSAGLHAFPERDLEQVLLSAGKQIRQKDWDNYHRGLSKSYFTNDNRKADAESMLRLTPPASAFSAIDFNSLERSCYLTDYSQRWVPCNHKNKPMIKWSKECLTWEEAMDYDHATWLAENLVMTPYIVFDIDGDHGNRLVPEVIRHFTPWLKLTHALIKPRLVREMDPSIGDIADAPTSFHLTFMTDRLIPTKHFPNARIDLLGNAKPQLRYRKNKTWNHIFPAVLTEEIWRFFMDYIATKEMAR